jgi:hypothetical protein
MRHKLFFSFLTFLFLAVNLAFGLTQGPNVGSVTSNVAIAGSTSTTLNRGNVFASDNVYASSTVNLPNSGDYTDYMFITGFGFAIPNFATIDGITVNIERSDVNGHCKDNILRLLKTGALAGSNYALNPAWPGTDAVQTYGSASDLWGTTWNYIEVNQSTFGVAFSWNRTGGGGGNSFASIDLITITVDYTLSPMPIKLLEFNAQQLGQQVKLDWKTATEINNDYFTLERTTDGTHFETFDTIEGAGNSIHNLSYTGFDETPLKGTSYYRLKQVDFNGDFTFSKLRAVNFNGDEAVLGAYPNPFSGKDIAVTLSGFDGITDVLNIVVCDALGRLVFNGTQEVSPAATRCSVSISLPDNVAHGI